MDKIVKNSKYSFPILLILFVAISTILFSSSKKKQHINYSKDELYLLSFLKSDSEAKKNNYNLIMHNAKKNNVFKILNCKFIPVVLDVDKNEKMEIYNLDKKDHIIEIDKDNIFEIPSSKKKIINLNIKNGNGIYGASCDGSPTLSGLFAVK